jgi:hypothetical protein
MTSESVPLPHLRAMSVPGVAGEPAVRVTPAATGEGPDTARVLVASSYNATKRTYGNLLYELCKVVRDVEDADLLAPEPAVQTSPSGDLASTLVKGRKMARQVTSKLRNFAGMGRLPTLAPSPVEKDYDFFFYVCAFPRELAELARFENWRSRSRRSAVFLLETWSKLLPQDRGELRILDQFDHVFVYQRSSLPAVQSYTRTPCSAITGGVDCLLATPFPQEPPRVIDVYSMGRRAPAMHDQLVRLAEEQKLFYVYDPVSHSIVLDWHESRLMTFNLIKRSRYFVAFDHMVGSPLKRAESGGEPAVPMRYYEGAAAGSVIIGSKPATSEFDEQFDWPDAVVDVPSEPRDVAAVLAELDAQPERMERIRRTNAVMALRRFDWAYRWREVLDVMGLPPGPKLDQRLRRLADTANAFDP